MSGTALNAIRLLQLRRATSNPDVSEVVSALANRAIVVVAAIIFFGLDLFPQEPCHALSMFAVPHVVPAKCYEKEIIA